jgi:hypothetical protein
MQMKYEVSREMVELAERYVNLLKEIKVLQKRVVSGVKLMG